MSDRGGVPTALIVLLIAAHPRRPVADAPDRVEAEPLRADVLPSQQGSELQTRARYELLTG